MFHSTIFGLNNIYIKKKKKNFHQKVFFLPILTHCFKMPPWAGKHFLVKIPFFDILLRPKMVEWSINYQLDTIEPLWVGVYAPCSLLLLWFVPLLPAPFSFLSLAPFTLFPSSLFIFLCSLLLFHFSSWSMLLWSGFQLCKNINQTVLPTA